MAEITVYNNYEDFRIELKENEGHFSISIENYSGKSKNVIIPASIGGIPVTAIGRYAFLHNEKLINVILPEGLLSIESSAFRDCVNLASINFPQSLTSIEYDAFEDCEKLVNIVFPKGLVDIANDAFSGCKNLKDIVVDDQNPVYASHDGILCDKNLTTLIKYPEGRKGAYVVPESIVEIVSDAFDNCGKLTEITFPNDFMYILAYMFTGCKQLSKINVKKDNPRLSSINGVLFNKKGDILLKYPQNMKNADYIVPDNVTHIAGSAFLECNCLNNIIIPEGLKFINECAFYKCRQLTAITLPISLLYIGGYAFDDCPNLKTVSLSRKTKFGYKAFEGFTGEIVYRD